MEASAGLATGLWISRLQGWNAPEGPRATGTLNGQRRKTRLRWGVPAAERGARTSSSKTLMLRAHENAFAQRPPRSIVIPLGQWADPTSNTPAPTACRIEPSAWPRALLVRPTHSLPW